MPKPIELVTDTEIFSRDPEKWDEESLEKASARLLEIVKRLRAQRKPPEATDDS